MPEDYTPPCKDLPEFDPDNKPEVPEGATVEDITEACIGGDGAFDQFMQAAGVHLEQEFKKQRIKGPEYSQVYLGGMQAAMAQAVAFTLGRDQAAIAAEMARYAGEKAFYENELIKSQICKSQAEIELLEQQKMLTTVQLWAEIAKTDDGIQEQMHNILDDDNLYGPRNTTTKSIIGSQVNTTIAEESLVKQKTDTELGNVDSSIFDDQSILGRKSSLHRAQANGFNRNAEVAIAKVYADYQSVATTALDDNDPGNELSNGGNVDSVLQTARYGVDNTEDVT